nr:MAG TPA: hypothetical protein [Caudoviricetes sp.]
MCNFLNKNCSIGLTNRLGRCTMGVQSVKQNRCVKREWR